MFFRRTAGLALMQVVGGRVTELGHAAAAKARRDTTALTYESHQAMADLAAAGRTLDEEWKGIGQWR